jgi:hypothetical protein
MCDGGVGITSVTPSSFSYDHVNVDRLLVANVISFGAIHKPEKVVNGRTFPQAEISGGTDGLELSERAVIEGIYDAIEAKTQANPNDQLGIGLENIANATIIGTNGWQITEGDCFVTGGSPGCTVSFNVLPFGVYTYFNRIKILEAADIYCRQIKMDDINSQGGTQVTLGDVSCDLTQEDMDNVEYLYLQEVADIFIHEICHFSTGIETDSTASDRWETDPLHQCERAGVNSIFGREPTRYLRDKGRFSEIQLLPSSSSNPNVTTFNATYTAAQSVVGGLNHISYANKMRQTIPNSLNVEWVSH